MVVRNRRKINKNKRIYVDVDLTTLQRETLKRLREELKSRTEAGEKVRIKYFSSIPKIVQDLN